MVNMGINLPIRVSVSPKLKIRGVLSTRKINKGEVIERCPAIIYKKKPEIIAKTIFEYYVFEWDKEHEALALGYGSLYNHSEEANVLVDFDKEKREIIFLAAREIDEGEELTIHYNDGDEEPIDPGYLSFDSETN